MVRKNTLSGKLVLDINPILLERFDAVLKKKGLRRSEVVRNLLDEYIIKNDNLQS